MELASLAAIERSHRRHDEVIAELLEAARRFAAGRPDDGDLDRVRGAVAYFERTVTRHFVDEDGSVFPRLSTRRPALAAQLAQLSAEHPTQITLQAEVAAAARELDGEARPSAGKALLDAATRLAAAHHTHVAREDEIFADAHDALTAQDDREISAEMAMRRERDPAAIPDAPRTGRPATRKTAARATGPTNKLTTRRTSLAARSSAKRAPDAPAKRASGATSNSAPRVSTKLSRPAATSTSKRRPSKPATSSKRAASARGKR